MNLNKDLEIFQQPQSWTESNAPLMIRAMVTVTNSNTGGFGGTTKKDMKHDLKVLLVSSAFG